MAQSARSAEFPSPFVFVLEHVVKQSVGFLLQMAVLMFLPMVIGWQLFFGFPLLVMPAATLVAILLFTLGHALRSSR